MALFKVEKDKGPPIPTILASANNGNIYILEGKKLKYRFDSGVNYQQIKVLNGMRAIIGGTSF